MAGGRGHGIQIARYPGIVSSHATGIDMVEDGLKDCVYRCVQSQPELDRDGQWLMFMLV